MPRPISRSATLLVLLGAAGCGPSRPARIVPPALDPEAVTTAVLSRADADSDGIVEEAELAAVPALVGAVEDMDADHDGGISKAELRRWFDRLHTSRIAITSFAGNVRHLQRPLANVTVKLTPEPFMGQDMKAAEGTTDADGRFSATIPGSKYPGINCGLYRVEITGQGNDGKPVAAKYNAQSILGAAVSGQSSNAGVANFVLE